MTSVFPGVLGDHALAGGVSLVLAAMLVTVCSLLCDALWRRMRIGSRLRAHWLTGCIVVLLALPVWLTTLMVLGAGRTADWLANDGRQPPPGDSPAEDAAGQAGAIGNPLRDILQVPGEDSPRAAPETLAHSGGGIETATPPAPPLATQRPSMPPDDTVSIPSVTRLENLPGEYVWVETSVEVATAASDAPAPVDANGHVVPSWQGRPQRVIATAGVVVWMAGVVWMVVATLRKVGRLHRVVTSSQPVDDCELLALAHEFDVDRRWPVSVRWTHQLSAPAACGLFRPCVLLPAGLRDQLTRTEWRAVLVHEYEHVRRGDLVIGWLQQAAATLYWWNVPLHAVHRRLEDMRERSCDEAVVASGCTPFEYAQLLLKVAVEHALPAPAAGLGAPSDAGFAQRVESLLNLEKDRVMAKPVIWFGRFAMVLLLLAVGGAAPMFVLLRAPTLGAETPFDPRVQESTQLSATDDSIRHIDAVAEAEGSSAVAFQAPTEPDVDLAGASSVLPPTLGLNSSPPAISPSDGFQAFGGEPASLNPPSYPDRDAGIDFDVSLEPSRPIDGAAGPSAMTPELIQELFGPAVQPAIVHKNPEQATPVTPLGGGPLHDSSMSTGEPADIPSAPAAGEGAAPGRRLLVFMKANPNGELQQLRVFNENVSINGASQGLSQILADRTSQGPGVCRVRLEVDPSLRFDAVQSVIQVLNQYRANVETVVAESRSPHGRPPRLENSRRLWIGFPVRVTGEPTTSQPVVSVDGELFRLSELAAVQRRLQQPAPAPATEAAAAIIVPPDALLFGELELPTSAPEPGLSGDLAPVTIPGETEFVFPASPAPVGEPNLAATPGASAGTEAVAARPSVVVIEHDAAVHPLILEELVNRLDALGFPDVRLQQSAPPEPDDLRLFSASGRGLPRS